MQELLEPYESKKDNLLSLDLQAHGNFLNGEKT
jgi:hypothetical protein